MINENEPCLKLRNRMSREEETYCKYYIKNFRGYLRSVILNHQIVGLFIMLLFVLGIFLPMYFRKKEEMILIIACVLGGLAVLSLIFIIIKNLWFWKYTKYVVVTNEGIWLMWHGAFWRKLDFAGKRRFLSPIWSLYSWNEIKISSDDNSRPRSPVKLQNFLGGF